MTFWKRQNSADSKWTGGFHESGVGGRVRIGTTQRIFRANDFLYLIILYDTTMTVTCPDTPVKTHRTYNTESDPDVNLTLWVMRTCTCRSIDCDKGPIWWDAGSGEAVHVWGKGLRELSVLHFAVNLHSF